MAKTFLMVDMPEDEDGCIGCRFWEDDICDSCYAMDEKPIDNIGERPDWCPLIQEPGRKELDITNDYKFCSAYGWNACLDELEGKT